MEVNAKAFGYVVLFLGAALLICIGGIVALAVLERTVPDILEITTGSLATGMLGMLIKTPEQPPVGD